MKSSKFIFIILVLLIYSSPGSLGVATPNCVRYDLSFATHYIHPGRLACGDLDCTNHCKQRHYRIGICNDPQSCCCR
ncbi:unnamed protein product [Amaranthus hypochondriacus]